jgi:hypothetical protein
MYLVVFPFVVIGIGEHRNVTPAGHVEGGFGGTDHQGMVMSFSVVYAVIAMVTRLTVLEALF